MPKKKIEIEKRKRTFYWYVEPLDPETNRIIGERLWEDSIMSEVKCVDDSRRDLWRCERKFISQLKRAKRSLNLKFNIWVQEGQGAIKPSVF